MEPTGCASIEPPAAAATAPTSASLTTAQQRSTSTATAAESAGQRNQPDASNGNSAFTAAAVVATSSSIAKASAVREDRDRLSKPTAAAVEPKVCGGDGSDFDSEVKECKKTVNSERASEAARSESAGNNNFPRKAPMDEESTPPPGAMVHKESINNGKTYPL